MNAFKMRIIQNTDPAIVAKSQGELVDRMDPGFWSPAWQEILGPMFVNHTTRTLGDFVPFITYGVIAVKNERYFTPEGVRYVSSTIVRPTGLDFTLNPLFIPIDDRRHDARRKPRHGDILFNRSGIGTLGRCTVFLGLTDDWVISDDVDIIRLEGLNPFYAATFLRSKFGASQIERLLHGVSGLTKISFSEIKSIQIPILSPSLDESFERNHMRMSEYHNRAIEAKLEVMNAQHGYDPDQARRNQEEYEHNLAVAESVANRLVQQLEELIDGKRAEIDPIEPTSE